MLTYVSSFFIIFCLQTFVYISYYLLERFPVLHVQSDSFLCRQHFSIFFKKLSQVYVDLALEFTD